MSAGAMGAVTGSLLLALGDRAVGYVQYAAWFVLVIGILIFVHELGHFLVAKRAGVGVLKLSLGFGPRLFGFRRGETDYIVSAIPLGGYVKMIGEDPKEQAADPEKSFSKKSLGWRSLIILAGPGSNFGLALVIFCLAFALVGIPGLPTVIGTPERGTEAGRLGLRAGDAIVAVDGEAVGRWDQLSARVQASQGRRLTLAVRRGGATFQVTGEPRPVKTLDIFGQEHEVWDLGLRLWNPPIIGQVVPGEPAHAAGLRARDRVVAADGQPVAAWDELADFIHQSAGKRVRLTVERAGARLEVEVTPAAARSQTRPGETEGRIGIGPISTLTFERVALPTAILEGGRKTVDVTAFTVVAFVKLVRGTISPKTIGGPLLVAQMAGQQAEQGTLELLFFVAALSINLAILNLLPIPILDGGHLLFSLLEWVKGTPVSLKKREIAQQVGLVLLVALMIFAFWNDFERIGFLNPLFRMFR